jgi:heme-degrading monooxygenase HmoA
MKLYITYGTISYLQKLIAEHQLEQDHLLFLQSEVQNALVVETDRENVFKEGSTYEIIESIGDFQDAHFVVMNNIPISEAGRPLFEERFKQRTGLVETEPGFKAIRILRPLESNTYIVMTLWSDASSFQTWQLSDSYKKAHEKKGTSEGLPHTLFTGKPYIKTYEIEENS